MHNYSFSLSHVELSCTLYQFNCNFNHLPFHSTSTLSLISFWQKDHILYWEAQKEGRIVSSGRPLRLEFGEFDQHKTAMLGSCWTLFFSSRPNLSLGIEFPTAELIWGEQNCKFIYVDQKFLFYLDIYSLHR